jgi:general secretion pathway protein G
MPGHRPGFTMVELMVVVLIIAILVALLVPAIASAVRAANDARVAAEENNLQTALASFKNLYGEYPPSRIVLHNSGVYNTADATQVNGTSDVTFGDLNARTVRALRKYWPRANAYLGGGAMVNPAGSATPSGWNGTGNAGGFVVLQGHECLVFFLGGIPQQVTTSAGVGYGVTGFNRDPANPFNFVANAPRTTPLFEFAPQRLVDTDGDHYPSYLDPLSSTPNVVLGQPGLPYAYFSAYGNNGYDPNDDNSSVAETDDATNPVTRPFTVNFIVGGPGGTHTSVSPSPNPYTNGDANQATAQWANPQTCQIISAGRDGLWGLGGAYDARATSQRLPVYATDTALSGTYPVMTNAVQVRKREADNITNFAAGRLD